jgi:hypothetical protein
MPPSANKINVRKFLEDRLRKCPEDPIISEFALRYWSLDSDEERREVDRRIQEAVDIVRYLGPLGAIELYLKVAKYLAKEPQTIASRDARLKSEKSYR